jgi:hypothetical protein
VDADVEREVREDGVEEEEIGGIDDVYVAVLDVDDDGYGDGDGDVDVDVYDGVTVDVGVV